jgi:hypothetical protein
VDLARVSPFGRARIEVHRALAYARHPTEPHRARTWHALEALDAVHDVLLSDTDTPRPERVWWLDDAAFLRSWQAEVLRSLAIPDLAVPVFRSALIVAAEEDVRELPFLQAGPRGGRGSGGWSRGGRRRGHPCGRARQDGRR